ncbi:MAG: hypothetical protein ACKN9X_06795, partial [Candidatus Methylopumilus sp.]
YLPFSIDPMWSSKPNAFAASREEVSHVWVNGILQYEEGHFASMDIQVCKDIALRWQLKLKQSI